MITSINIGGLIAVGFDEDCNYLLTVSHSGRGLYETLKWTRLDRDNELIYPENGSIFGIGALSGIGIRITEINYETGILTCVSPNGEYSLVYSEGIMEIQHVII